MQPIPVIAVFDVGKTNKKLFLFDQQYNIVYERSARFLETVDEDGDPCENLESLRLSVFDSLRSVFARPEFVVKAVNFTSYGASFVYLDEDGQPLTPLYNYLKRFPEALSEQFYTRYGGKAAFARQSASPVLGSLNSGLQLYRIRYERPELFEKIKWALHLPQYLSFLITGRAATDITSIGCHTNLWDFDGNGYHEWVYTEGLREKFAPLVSYDDVAPAVFPGSHYLVGSGLHDSSAALIPYLISFQEPFVLLSTGTWSISLNPFNPEPLTFEELEQDCLCYLHYQGRPVKASRFFAGKEHEDGLQRISAHFNCDVMATRNLLADVSLVDRLRERPAPAGEGCIFSKRDLSIYADMSEAYHQLMIDIVDQQVRSTNLVLPGAPVKRLFVDGGFSKNHLFMTLLATAYPQLEIFAASMAQATALGAALALHKTWNPEPLPNSLIRLHYFTAATSLALDS